MPSSAFALAVCALHTPGIRSSPLWWRRGLHLWAAYAHRKESWLLAAGFVGAAVLQLWGARTFVRSAGRMKVAVVTGNLAAVGAWFLSRLVGLPFGPHAGVPEAVSALDALTVAVEVAALTGVVVLSWRSAGRPAATGGRRRSSLPGRACSPLAAGPPSEAAATTPRPMVTRPESTCRQPGSRPLAHMRATRTPRAASMAGEMRVARFAAAS